MDTSERTGSPLGVHVLGVPVHPIEVGELHAAILRFVRGRLRATVLHANVHAINLARHDPCVMRTFRDADLVFCDGHGVMLGARLLGHRLPAKITYAEWTWCLADLCAREGLSLYMLGSRPGVAAAAADRLRTRHPGLRIAGTRHGYFDMSVNADDNRSVLADVNAARPDILMVGFGMPLQERWIAANRHAIDAPVVLSAGAAFDYVSGALRRPPRWMTSTGFEWLGRLIIEPRRLAGRYILGNPAFLLRILRERTRRSLSAHRAR